MHSWMYYYPEGFQSDKYERIKKKICASDWISRAIIESKSHIRWKGQITCKWRNLETSRFATVHYLNKYSYITFSMYLRSKERTRIHIAKPYIPLFHFLTGIATSMYTSAYLKVPREISLWSKDIPFICWSQLWAL